MEHQNLDLNRFLVCQIDEEAKTVTTSMFDVGDIQKNLLSFHKLMYGLKDKFRGYTVTASVPLTANNVMIITAQVP